MTLVRWTLTLFGFAFAVVLLLALIYMIHPVDFDGLGVIGLYVFLIPSQLLIVCLFAAIVAPVFWRIRFRWPSLAFTSIALVALPMSIWPTLSVYKMAREQNVQVSFLESLIPSVTLGGIQRDKSVRYATVDGTDLMLDLWPSRAEGAALRPVVVRVHGGGWVAGTRSELPAWNTWLNGLGYVVFDVEYRLAPPVRWLDEVGDVKCALGWIVAHAEQYRIDVNRISMLGYSAGGHLAMMASYTMGDPNVPATCDAKPVRVNAVVNLYGPADLPHGYYHGGSPHYVQHVMNAYIGGPPEAFADRYRILSPLTHINANTPPTITILGTSDRIVSTYQAEVLDKALTAASAPHETYLLPASDHAFDANWNGLSAQFARAKVREFLGRYGGKETHVH